MDSYPLPNSEELKSSLEGMMFGLFSVKASTMAVVMLRCPPPAAISRKRTFGCLGVMCFGVIIASW